MNLKSLKRGPLVSLVLTIMVALFCQPGQACAASILNTDKEVYNQGEAIRVNYSDWPGFEGDWICIVPSDAADNTGGDYKYLPQGLGEGSVSFNPPAPGKYEARAYYNYKRNGYVVAGRTTFTVQSSPEWEAAMAQRLERKLDPRNPLEAGQPPGNGLIYLFREPLFISSSFEAQIKANGKPVLFMQNASYFPFSVPAGVIDFTSGGIRENLSSAAGTESMIESRATVKVKQGYAYYLKVKLVPRPFWSVALEPVLHQEGASSIEAYQLRRLEK